MCVKQALYQLSHIFRPQVVLLFEVFFSFYVYACMWLCAREYRCLGGRSRVSDPLELVLQVSVSCSRWVLGREFKFSGRRTSALTAKASPALRVTYYKGVDSSASFLPQICLLPGTAARESLCRKLSTARGALGGQEDGLWPQAPLSVLF